VANSNGTPLTPNNLSSKIQFHLDDNAAARVGIRAWPISVTGIKPAEGPFTARGYLRVDYD
ncbi:adhesin, partial [Salmonella enterica subsp. enterica serovar Typhimurium]